MGPNKKEDRWEKQFGKHKRLCLKRKTSKKAFIDNLREMNLYSLKKKRCLKKYLKKMVAKMKNQNLTDH